VPQRIDRGGEVEDVGPELRVGGNLICSLERVGAGARRSKTSSVGAMELY